MYENILLLALALTFSAVPAIADEPSERLTPQEIVALPATDAGPGTSGVTDMRTTVLSGDPSRAGLYTIQIVIPPHTTIKAHQHRDGRVATVISGMWFLGYGAVRDEKSLKALPAGSFYTEPAGAAHFAGTGELPATVQITGFGPSDTVYVNTGDDSGRP